MARCKNGPAGSFFRRTRPLHLVPAIVPRSAALVAMLIILAVVFGLAVLPQMWVRRVIARALPRACRFPGHGRRVRPAPARRDEAQPCQVEETKLGDHYDPDAKVIRLLPQHFNGRSLAAVVIAAHEAGHAMQDATGYQPLQARTRLAKQAIRMEKVGAIVMLAAPIVMALAKAPHILVIEVFAGVMILAMIDRDARVDAAGRVRRQLPPRAARAEGRRLRQDEDMPAAREDPARPRRSPM